MRSLIQVSMLLVLVFSAHEAAAETPQPKGPARDVSFTVPSTYGELQSLGEELYVVKHPDYPGLIREVAKGSEEALASFFTVSATSPWDAAAGEAHGSTIRLVLLHWGDLGFSKALAKQPVNVRQMVGEQLIVEDDAVRLLFPLTYTACTGRKAEQAGAVQPATKPADKPPVKKQPSTPTPKDGPR